MKNRVIFLLVSIYVLFLFAGCSKFSNKKENTVHHKEVTIERFDRDFLQYMQSKDISSENKLKSQYPVFLSAFGKITVNLSDNSRPVFFENLYKYFSDSTLQHVYRDSEKQFDNVEDIETELSQANENLWKIYPGKQLPRFCMHVSGLKQNVVVTDSVISISIDKYLGENYPLYKDFFYDYQRVQMQPQNVTRDYLRAYILSSLIPDNKNQDLVSAMIHEGKCLYLLSKLLPEKSIDELLGYNQKQMKWSKANERAVWRTTIERKFLYSTEYLIISKYMDEASYTSLISPLCPGKIGAWLGLQIVDNFMKNNPQVEIATLISMDDHKLLEQSHYNP